MGIETHASGRPAPGVRHPVALTADGEGDRASEVDAPARRSASGVATMIAIPCSRSRVTARSPAQWATGRWKRVPTEPRNRLGREHVRRRVARDHAGRSGSACGADDRAEVAGPLDAFRHEDERVGSWHEPRQRRRPALGDRKETVRSRPVRQRPEGSGADLDDAHATPFGKQQQLVVTRAEEQLRRRVDLPEWRPGFERPLQLPMALD